MGMNNSWTHSGIYRLEWIADNCGVLPNIAYGENGRALFSKGFLGRGGATIFKRGSFRNDENCDFYGKPKEGLKKVGALEPSKIWFMFICVCCEELALRNECKIGFRVVAARQLRVGNLTSN